MADAIGFCLKSTSEDGCFLSKMGEVFHPHLGRFLAFTENELFYYDTVIRFHQMMVNKFWLVIFTD